MFFVILERSSKTFVIVKKNFLITLMKTQTTNQSRLDVLTFVLFQVDRDAGERRGAKSKTIISKVQWLVIHRSVCPSTVAIHISVSLFLSLSIYLSVYLNAKSKTIISKVQRLVIHRSVCLFVTKYVIVFLFLSLSLQNHIKGTVIIYTQNCLSLCH